MTGFPDEPADAPDGASPPRDGAPGSSARPDPGSTHGGTHGGTHGAGPGVPDNLEHLQRLDRLSRLGGETQDDELDPVERLLRPAPAYLAPPPGSFEQIRGRAARRRRLRTAAGFGTAAAVAAAALYAGGVLAPRGDGHAVAPPATSGVTSLPVPPPSTHGAPTPAPSTTAPATGGGPSSGGAEDPASPTPSSPPRTSPSPSEGTPMCAAGQLRVALGGGDAGAGQLYRYLVLTNTGSTACHVDGYPGVSLLDADGKQIGKPADRDPRAYSPVVLHPGESASDTIHTANGMGTCQPASARIRVYPPGSRQSLTAAGSITVCAGTFTITPLAAGATGNPPS
jgi:hypothetical protein